MRFRELNVFQMEVTGGLLQVEELLCDSLVAVHQAMVNICVLIQVGKYILDHQVKWVILIQDGSKSFIQVVVI